MKYIEEISWWIASISLSSILAIIGIIIAFQLHKRNSLKFWQKKLSKRLHFIMKHSKSVMDKRWIYDFDHETKKEKTIREISGFELATHAYWGYHRNGSAYEYNFIVPFIELTSNKNNYGLYVWITYDPNCKDSSGKIAMENSDLQKLEFVGKAGQNITKEMLGSVERVKVIYNWYVNFEKCARLKKMKNSKSPLAFIIKVWRKININWPSKN